MHDDNSFFVLALNHYIFVAYAYSLSLSSLFLDWMFINYINYNVDGFRLYRVRFDETEVILEGLSTCTAALFLSPF